jgi:hypothetical protein
MCEYQQQERDAQPGNDGQVARVHGEHVVHARAPHLPPNNATGNRSIDASDALRKRGK